MPSQDAFQDAFLRGQPPTPALLAIVAASVRERGAPITTLFAKGDTPC